MRVLRRIRQAVRERQYRISSHANEEMSNDELVLEDIERILLTGEIRRTLADDPRGDRYEIVGDAIDGRRGCVVCRFLPSDVLLLITIYAEE